MDLGSGQDTILNSLFQLWMLGALDNLGAGFSDSLGQRYVPRPENVSASLRTSRSWETRWRNSHWHRAQQQTLASQRIDPINACKYSTRIAVWNHNGHGDSASLRTHHCQKCSLLVKRLAVARRPDAWALHSTIIPSTISIHVIQWFRFLCQKRNILKLTYAFWIDLSALVASLFPWDHIQLPSQIMSIVSMLSVPSIFFRPKESSNGTTGQLLLAGRGEENLMFTLC